MSYSRSHDVIKLNCCKSYNPGVTGSNLIPVKNVLVLSRESCIN